MCSLSWSTAPLSTTTTPIAAQVSALQWHPLESRVLASGAYDKSLVLRDTRKRPPPHDSKPEQTGLVLRKKERGAQCNLKLSP